MEIGVKGGISFMGTIWLAGEANKYVNILACSPVLSLGILSLENNPDIEV